MSTLAQWRNKPIDFIEHVLCDPETGKPFELLPAERHFLEHAFKLDANGRLLYPEQLYGAPKKSGKTGFAALHLLTTVLLFGGHYAEAYALANDQEQSIGRVFQAIRRIVECSPLLRNEAKITVDKIVFPAFSHATVHAIASDAASAAGANPTISSFDELWGFTSERSRRLWDEMIPPPTRKIALRLTTTYAGYFGESNLLEELFARGKALPEVAPSLHAGEGLLFAWHHGPIAPWQDERWLSEMRRSLRPNAYARMIQNMFVSSESTFVDMGSHDACVHPTMTPVMQDRSMHIWVGVDASVKHDSTALVMVNADKKTGIVRLINHKVFTPTPGDPIDFEMSVERTLLDWYRRFRVRQIFYDPFQMAASAQRLLKAHLPMIEFPQTVPNLTAASNNLFELINSRSIALYPDAGMRLAISRAVVTESSRGWKIDKAKQSHKIDVVVALAQAALAAVRGASEPYYSLWYPNEDEPEEPPPLKDFSLVPEVGRPRDMYTANIPGHLDQKYQDWVFDVADEMSSLRREHFLRCIGVALKGKPLPTDEQIRGAIAAARTLTKLALDRNKDQQNANHQAQR